MPPKKTAAPTDGSRRSSRIASNPAPVAPPRKKVATKAASKKRAQEATDEKNEEPASKKVKSDETEGVEPPAEGTDAGTLEEDKKNDAAPPPEEKEADELAEESPPPEEPELQVGDVLPDITLKNEKGDDVRVKDLVTPEQGVVFFLVPKADTPGCTTQACAFRDSYSEFTEVKYAVYCVSADTSAAQAKWQSKKELPFPLLSDPQRVFIKALGAFKPPKSTSRSHFVFEKGTGKLVEKRSSVKPAESSKLALEFIKRHHPEPAKVPSAETEETAPVPAAETMDTTA